MLIKRLSTPTTQLFICGTPPTHYSKEFQSKHFNLHYRCRHIKNYSHQQQYHHHQYSQYLQKQKQQQQPRCILLLIALILLQQVELNACHQLAQRSIKRLSLTDKSSISSSSALLKEPKNFDLPQSKRAELTQNPSVGQAEEVFAIDNNQMDSNYDEYPMVVPKRAALLLDRLMVALHNALEKDRITQQHRIGELNEKIQNGEDTTFNTNQKPIDDEAVLESGLSQIDNMYGDDPNILDDYNFKDLNSINRATGETLIGKSYQRRANMAGPEGMALLATGTATRATGKGVSSGGRRINTGRMYWRCYFNAVSCF